MLANVTTERIDTPISRFRTNNNERFLSLDLTVNDTPNYFVNRYNRIASTGIRPENPGTGDGGYLPVEGTGPGSGRTTLPLPKGGTKAPPPPPPTSQMCPNGFPPNPDGSCPSCPDGSLPDANGNCGSGSGSGGGSGSGSGSTCPPGMDPIECLLLQQFLNNPSGGGSVPGLGTPVGTVGPGGTTGSSSNPAVVLFLLIALAVGGWYLWKHYKTKIEKQEER